MCVCREPSSCVTFDFFFWVVVVLVALIAFWLIFGKIHSDSPFGDIATSTNWYRARDNHTSKRGWRAQVNTNPTRKFHTSQYGIQVPYLAVRIITLFLSFMYHWSLIFARKDKYPLVSLSLSLGNPLVVLHVTVMIFLVGCSSCLLIDIRTDT